MDWSSYTTKITGLSLSRITPFVLVAKSGGVDFRSIGTELNQRGVSTSPNGGTNLWNT